MAQLFDTSVMSILGNQGNLFAQLLFNNLQNRLGREHDLNKLNLLNQFQIDSEGRTEARTKPYMDQQEEYRDKLMKLFESMLGGNNFRNAQGNSFMDILLGGQ